MLIMLQQARAEPDAGSHQKKELCHFLNRTILGKFDANLELRLVIECDKSYNQNLKVDLY